MLLFSSKVKGIPPDEFYCWQVLEKTGSYMMPGRAFNMNGSDNHYYFRLDNRKKQLSTCSLIHLTYIYPHIHVGISSFFHPSLPLCLSVRLCPPSICLSICPSVHLSVSQSLSICQSVSLVCLSVRSLVSSSYHPSVCSSVCLSIRSLVNSSFRPSVCLFVRPSVLKFSRSVRLSFRPLAISLRVACSFWEWGCHGSLVHSFIIHSIFISSFHLFIINYFFTG